MRAGNCILPYFQYANTARPLSEIDEVTPGQSSPSCWTEASGGAPGDNARLMIISGWMTLTMQHVGNVEVSLTLIRSKSARRMRGVISVLAMEIVNYYKWSACQTLIVVNIR